MVHQPGRIVDLPMRTRKIQRLGKHRYRIVLLLLASCVLLGSTNLDWKVWSPSDRTSVATQAANGMSPAEPVQKLLQQHRDIGFLHVGKTGGATVSRLIRRACFSVAGCQNHVQQLPLPESHISQLVTRYYHMRAPTQKQKQRHTSFLVTVRDPLDRAASWYIFRHPSNAGRLDVSPTRNPVVLELFACYPNSFEELVTTGLARRVSQKERRCAHLAREIMTGTIRPTRNGDHMAWNYRFYLRDILLANEETELFVIRTEHLWEDWQKIDVLLGGKGNAPIAHSVSHQRQSGNASERLPIYNKTLSSTGTANLCCALQEDLKIYVTALKRAVNLNASQVKETIDRLEVKCGSLDRRGKQCQSWYREGSIRFWERMFGHG